MNAKMPELKRCFEKAGFSDVKTVLSSGNVVFSSPIKSVAELERKAEAAMTRQLGRTFYTLVRPVSALNALIEADPYAAFALPLNAKCVVSFLREPPKGDISMPRELDGARILTIQGREIFSVYVPGPRGPVFMKLIERTFGSDITTRTWDTVKKCAKG